eukprot:GSChrysophyteH1.ASY1.ANO1.613.1 assembled CDS
MADQRKIMVWKILVVLAVLVISVAASDRPHNSVSLKIRNRAGKAVDVYWINTMSNSGGQDYVLQNTKPLRNGTTNNIYSYDTHSFLAEFHNPPEEAKGASAVFTKGPEDEEAFVEYNPETLEMSVRLMTKKDQVEQKVKDKTDECKRLHVDKGGLQSDAFVECITGAVSEDLIKAQDRIEHLNTARTKISHRLRNYTCEDPESEATKPQRTYLWSHQGKAYDVEVLMDKPTARIWLVHDFVTSEECDVLITHGKPRLARATVAADDGTSIVSENRKAQQASYSVSGESFTIIQYNPSDQYTPHCDGNCDGSPHNKYGRVATSVMYCVVPEVGGATTFTNNDIFVKPRKGSATFFAYKDMDSKLMDDADTEHSGCPVIEGEKWITTVWMREGVSDAPDENWTLYDPDGTRIGAQDEENVTRDEL